MIYTKTLAAWRSKYILLYQAIWLSAWEITGKRNLDPFKIVNTDSERKPSKQKEQYWKIRNAHCWSNLISIVSKFVKTPQKIVRKISKVCSSLKYLHHFCFNCLILFNLNIFFFECFLSNVQTIFIQENFSRNSTFLGTVLYLIV